MSLFECQKCHCIENTAVGCYWGRKEKLCSECGFGEWHGLFSKKPAIGMLIDDRGFLWSKAQIENGGLPTGLEIVGEVQRKAQET